MTQTTTLDQAVDSYEIAYRDDPVSWASDILGVSLWSMQRDILESVFTNRKIVVRSCNSAGKTFVAAVAVLAFLYLRYPSKVITTAPTWYQVQDLLWSEINALFKQRLQDRVPGRVLTTKLDIEDDWFAVGLSPKEAVNFQGYHQENVLVVFDEAPGVRQDVVDGAETLEASGDVHLLKIGNPIEQSGHFYNDFRDPTFVKFHIPYHKTPNFTGEKVPDKVSRGLITPEWVDDKRQRWGEDSPMFISKCEADFPAAGSNQVISLSLCEQAAKREVAAEGDIYLSVDVARGGGDLTVFTRRRGAVILDQETQNTRDTMQIVGRIGVLHNRDRYRNINIDVIGVGAGVYDRGRELGYPVVAINSAESAIDEKLYANKRTEMWFNFGEWLEYGKIPNDADLIADLTAPQYKYTSKGQYQLEKKEDTKKRLGGSPDRGDSAVYSTSSAGGGSLGFFVLGE
jgi:hypothetical protein